MTSAPKPPKTSAKFSYDISPDTGLNTKDHYTSGGAAHELTLSGTGAANDAITISYRDPASHTTVTLTTTVQANGTWSLTTGSLAEGTYKFSFTESGTLKASASSPNWVVDTHTDADISNNASFTNQNVVPLNGTAEAGDTVKVTYLDPGTQQTITVGTVTADSTGHWSLSTAALADNSYTFTAAATDKAGNTATSTYSITIDTPLGVTLTGNDADGVYVLNSLSGGTGDDTLTGGNALNAGFVENYLGGEDDNDILTGGSADGASAYNTLSGGTADDILIGGDSSNWGYVNNKLYGEDGNDTLTGGSSDGTAGAWNYLYAGTGDDTLTGGNSSHGGVFNYFYLDLSVGDHVYGGGSGTSNYLSTSGTSGDDNLTITAGGWSLNGSPLDITGTFQEFSYYAGEGNDVIDTSQSGLSHVGVFLDDLNVGDHVHGGSEVFLSAPGTGGDDNLVITAGSWTLNGSVSTSLAFRSSSTLPAMETTSSTSAKAGSRASTSRAASATTPSSVAVTRIGTVTSMAALAMTRSPAALSAAVLPLIMSMANPATIPSPAAIPRTEALSTIISMAKTTMTL
jgi:Bacterial Ig-like domain